MQVRHDVPTSVNHSLQYFLLCKKRNFHVRFLYFYPILPYNLIYRYGKVYH